MASNSGHKFRLRNLEGLRNNFESLKTAAKRGAGKYIIIYLSMIISFNNYIIFYKPKLWNLSQI
jgi:hypothetical protein